MSKPFCIMPWVHVHTRPTGDASPCCVFDLDKPVSNTNNLSLEQIAHSDSFNYLRKQMMLNSPPKECYDCTSKHKSSIDELSYRFWQNNNFSHLVDDLIENTNSDGSLKKEFSMKFMNIRYSNLCNMACRTCGSHSSSLWAQEEKFSNPVIKISDSQPTYLENIFLRLKDVEVINFAGGESILVPEHWEVLDKLLELEKTNVKIFYVTNLSKLSYQRKNILDYAQKFPNMIIRGSIDASHSRAELYRHGTHWPTVEHNLKEIYNNNINFKTNCTIGAMNVWHAPDLQQYLIEENLIKLHQFSLNILTKGEMLSIKVLPKFYKKIVEEKILIHKTWCNKNNIPTTQWDLVIKFMNSEDHSHLFEHFKKYNLDLDLLRNQSTTDVFPELKLIF